MGFKMKGPTFFNKKSPLKATTELAAPIYHFSPDVPADVLGEEKEDIITPEEDVIIPEKGTSEDPAIGEKERYDKLVGTGEEYKGRKQRREEKLLAKAQAKAISGKKYLTKEERRDINIQKLEEKQKEASSKGKRSYRVSYSFGSGLQEGVEPKADRLGRKISKKKKKRAGDQPVTGTTPGGREYKVMTTKERTKAIKKK